MPEIPISLIYEDELSGNVLLKILPSEFVPARLLQANGISRIKDNILRYNGAAVAMPYLVLIDLDTVDCAPTCVRSLFPHNNMHPNLIFRIAVHEVESWLLADQEAFARFAGISRVLVPENVDILPDPKQELMNLIRRSRRRFLHDAILPRHGSTAQVGRQYNETLSDFVSNNWRPNIARTKSDSLNRAMNALEMFCPVWPTI